MTLLYSPPILNPDVRKEYGDNWTYCYCHKYGNTVMQDGIYRARHNVFDGDEHEIVDRDNYNTLIEKSRLAIEKVCTCNGWYVLGGCGTHSRKLKLFPEQNQIIAPRAISQVCKGILTDSEHGAINTEDSLVFCDGRMALSRIKVTGLSQLEIYAANICECEALILRWASNSALSKELIAIAMQDFKCALSFSAKIYNIMGKPSDVDKA